jgi:iron complex outermembrane recepter protein
MQFNLQRFFTAAPMPALSRTYKSQFSPRIVLSKKIQEWFIYGSYSRGFSPPTSAEVTPSGSSINLELEPEKGSNYELGVKAQLSNGLFIDITAFQFNLDQTIVQRRDAGGGDYFVNSGKTSQRGLETYLSYPLLRNFSALSNSLLWASHTWHHFYYRSFEQVNFDFSGKQLPGVAPQTVAAGLDIITNSGFGGALTYLYAGSMPLNDANTASASSYHLIGMKASYEKKWSTKVRIKLVGGVDNLLDETYSLGNDINGFGGRFYNAAPNRNYYAAIILQPCF